VNLGQEKGVRHRRSVTTCTDNLKEREGRRGSEKGGRRRQPAKKAEGGRGVAEDTQETNKKVGGG